MGLYHCGMTGRPFLTEVNTDWILLERLLVYYKYHIAVNEVSGVINVLITPISFGIAFKKYIKKGSI